MPPVVGAVRSLLQKTKRLALARSAVRALPLPSVEQSSAVRALPLPSVEQPSEAQQLPLPSVELPSTRMPPRLGGSAGNRRVVPTLGRELLAQLGMLAPPLPLDRAGALGDAQGGGQQRDAGVLGEAPAAGGQQRDVNSASVSSPDRGRWQAIAKHAEALRAQASEAEAGFANAAGLSGSMAAGSQFAGRVQPGSAVTEGTRGAGSARISRQIAQLSKVLGLDSPNARLRADTPSDIVATIDAACRTLPKLLPTSSPTELTDVIHASAAIPLIRQHALIPAAKLAALQCAALSTEQLGHLANVSAKMTSKMESPPVGAIFTLKALLTAISAELVLRPKEFAPQDAARVGWGLAHSGIPAPDAFASLCTELQIRPTEFAAIPQTLANLSWAVVASGCGATYQGSSALLSLAAAAVAPGGALAPPPPQGGRERAFRKMPEMIALSQIAHAFSSLPESLPDLTQTLPDFQLSSLPESSSIRDDLFAAIASHATRQLRVQAKQPIMESPRNVATLAWAFAVRGKHDGALSLALARALAADWEGARSAQTNDTKASASVSGPTPAAAPGLPAVELKTQENELMHLEALEAQNKKRVEREALDAQQKKRMERAVLEAQAKKLRELEARYGEKCKVQLHQWAMSLALDSLPDAHTSSDHPRLVKTMAAREQAAEALAIIPPAMRASWLNAATSVSIGKLPNKVTELPDQTRGLSETLRRVGVSHKLGGQIAGINVDIACNFKKLVGAAESALGIPSLGGDVGGGEGEGRVEWPLGVAFEIITAAHYEGYSKVKRSATDAAANCIDDADGEDGMAHPRQLKANHRLKYRLLSQLGIAVVPVPYWELEAQETHKARIAHLRTLLASAGATDALTLDEGFDPVKNVEVHGGWDSAPLETENLYSKFEFKKERALEEPQTRRDRRRVEFGRPNLRPNLPPTAPQNPPSGYKPHVGTIGIRARQRTKAETALRPAFRDRDQYAAAREPEQPAEAPPPIKKQRRHKPSY